MLGAVEELHKLLPIRTFIAVIRSSGSGIWVDASHSHKVSRSTVAVTITAQLASFRLAMKCCRDGNLTVSTIQILFGTR